MAGKDYFLWRVSLLGKYSFQAREAYIQGSQIGKLFHEVLKMETLKSVTPARNGKFVTEMR